jgi:hypothetical protein
MSFFAASFIRFTASSLGKSHHSIQWLIVIFPKLMATNWWFLGAKSCEKSLLSDKRDG